jgi:cyclopropane-fatty-acyl-phospholipid synthase
MATLHAVRAVRHPLVSHVLDDLLVDFGRQDFRIQLWDGTTWGVSEEPRFTLILNDPEALRTLFVDPTQLSLGEAYIAGAFEVQGDLDVAFELGDYLLSRKSLPGISHALLSLLNKLPSHTRLVSERRGPQLQGPVHSKARDQQAIHYHYDLPPEFFGLWLDPHMLYSCAYFADAANIDVDRAQERKLEYICRKLRLRKGDQLLDIGCGWGGLLLYAAAHFGVSAQGITVSVRQAEIARKRIHEANLNRQCRVEVCDYRDLQADQFDKIVSIGMFEHVGEALLPEYFQRASDLLRPGGVFLNSGISLGVSQPPPDGPSFIDRYVFPDGELVPLHVSLRAAEACGFEVRDVESLREHYAMTLHQWVKRLEANSEKARALTDDTTYRIWRLYMAGSEHQFRSGALNLYQMLLVKPLDGNSGLPLTRADWYC